jgi:hypothetical protein
MFAMKEMNTKDFVHDLTRRYRRAGMVIAFFVVAHIVVEFGPRVIDKLDILWRSLLAFGIEDNSFSTCLLFLGSTLLAFVLLLATIAIWALSIAVTWAAFCRSGKKAYIFVLAYFLLAIAFAPSSRAIRRHIATRQLCDYQVQQADDSIHIDNSTHHPPVAMQTKLSLPLPAGPLLLLAGLWYLYKKEELANKSIHGIVNNSPNHDA